MSSTSTEAPSAVVASIFVDSGSNSHATDSTSTIVEDRPSAPSVSTAEGQLYFTTNVPGLPSVHLVDGITITAGNSAQQINGHDISALRKGIVVVDGTTVTPAPVSASTLDIMQSIRTGSDGLSTTEAIIDGSIIVRPGSNIVLGSHTYSLGPSGVAVDGTATYPVLDSPISAEGATGVYMIDSMTISAVGSANTVDGVMPTAQSSILVVDGFAEHGLEYTGSFITVVRTADDTGASFDQFSCDQFRQQAGRCKTLRIVRVRSGRKHGLALHLFTM
ncbi:hypothetical protein LTS10_002012 [Elasticomyces elasticus]|nr:hypothetical protein LTS10_002012 [Elasticomyces elasticus]